MKANNSSKRKAIRVLIVDDESLARKRIKDLLSGRDEFEIVGECSNGKDAIKAIQNGITDLLFLDIQMRDMDGFEVLERVKTDILPTIIFVTAYDKYALKAFEVHAVDYLLKPFDDERFEEMLKHASKQIKKDKIRDLGEKLTDLISDYKNAENVSRRRSSINDSDFYQKRLVIKSTGKISFIEVEDIDWISAEGSYVTLNINGKTHLMRETLKKLEKILDPRKFLRIHRSTIINVSRVKEMQSHFHGEYIVILKDGKRLKLSRNYREKADQLLGGQF